MKPQSAKGITPASRKQKGRILQQWTRDKILLLFPKLTLDDVRSTSMGAGGEDILLSTAARKFLPLTFECKSRKSVAIYKDYDQAKGNAPDGAEPVVIIKQNQRKPLAIVDAEYFLNLHKKGKK